MARADSPHDLSVSRCTAACEIRVIRPHEQWLYACGHTQYVLWRYLGCYVVRAAHYTPVGRSVSQVKIFAVGGCAIDRVGFQVLQKLVGAASCGRRGA